MPENIKGCPEKAKRWRRPPEKARESETRLRRKRGGEEVQRRSERN